MERLSSLAVRTSLLAAFLAFAVRVLAATWRVRRIGRGTVDEALARGPAVMAFLHGDQLPLIALHRDLPVAGMTSLSEDGTLLAGVLTRLGYATVRGSSSRGGARAAVAALQALREGQCPGIAVDGPRGPRGEAKGGASFLARRADVPIAWFRIDARPALRLGSWDRFQIPWPFARVVVHSGVLVGDERSDAEVEAALSPSRSEDG